MLNYDNVKLRCPLEALNIEICNHCREFQY